MWVCGTCFKMSLSFISLWRQEGNSSSPHVKFSVAAAFCNAVFPHIYINGAGGNHCWFLLVHNGELEMRSERKVLREEEQWGLY